MRDKLKDKMTEVSDYIFQHPELSKHEEQSSRALADFLEQEGFTVKWELAGFRTAFVAEWGSGQPIIGFLAEYDGKRTDFRNGSCLWLPCGRNRHRKDPYE